jgi:predicted nucleic acid-binding protein
LKVYVDSSFVVSLYITDSHSPEARRHVQQVSSLPLTPLHRAEWSHALGQQQFWGNLSSQKAATIDSHFVADEAAGLWQATDLPDRAFDICADLARKHGAAIGVRTLDSLHVATALELRAERFWTFDERQAKLAKARGLKIN